MMPVGQALAGPAAAALGADNVLLVAGAMTLVVATALLSVPAIRGLVRAEAPTSRSLSLSHGSTGMARPARTRTGGEDGQGKRQTCAGGKS